MSDEIDYERWADFGGPETERKSRFELRKKSFITGDFSKEAYATSPLNTGCIGYDPPEELNTWKYEVSQRTDLEIQKMTEEIESKKYSLDFPRKYEDLIEKEKNIIQANFKGDLKAWNEYLGKLKIEFGKINVLGIILYTQEAGLV